MARKKRFDESKVLQDATMLFWKKGFHQTSIQDLVDTLGVNRASLYDSYSDKEDLFKHCLNLYKNDAIASAKKILHGQRSIKSGFKSFFKWIIKSISEDPDKKGCFICNTYSELLPSKPNEIHNLLHETKNLWMDTIFEALKHGFENNELKKNVNIQKTTHAIYASMVGITIISKTTKKTEELTHSLEPHLQIFK